MIVILSVIDWGQAMNLEMDGREYYRPGEVVQAHLLILGEHVWLERSRRIDGGVLYRLSFGEVPQKAELIDYDELSARLKIHFLGLVELRP